MKRRVLSKIKLTEISAVDRPCQEHARVAILKRAPGNHQGDDHMPDDTEVVEELEAQVTDLEAQIADLNKQLDALTKEDDEGKPVRKRLGKPSVDELQKKVEDLEKAAQAAADEKAEIEKFTKALSELSEDEAEFYKAMTDDEQKKDFLSMSPAERKKAQDECKKNEETLEVGGQQIKKSVVGTATFAILKAQNEAIRKANEDIAVERVLRETAEFKKAADDKYAHVPGSTDERAEMLRAIDKMEEPLKKSFMAVLEQSEKLAKAGFGSVGHTGKGDKPGASAEMKKAADQFESAVEKIATERKISKTEAMAVVRKSQPDLFKAYQEIENSN